MQSVSAALCCLHVGINFLQKPLWRFRDHIQVIFPINSRLTVACILHGKIAQFGVRGKYFRSL